MASKSSTTSSINLGPLTTKFEPTFPACRSVYRIESAINSGVFTWDQIGPPGSHCQPPDYDVGKPNYFSPGQCPVGSTIACHSSIENGVTEATCCPNGYSCQRLANGNVLRCVTTLGNPEFLTVVYNKIDATGHTLTATTSVASFGSRYEIYDYGIVVRNSMLIPSETSTIAAGENLTNFVTGLMNSSSDSMHGRESLSPGTLAGITVGAILGVLFFVGVIAGAYLHRRRTKQRCDEREIGAVHSPLTESGSSDLPALELENKGRCGELQAERNPCELGVLEKPAELNG